MLRMPQKKRRKKHVYFVWYARGNDIKVHSDKSPMYFAGISKKQKPATDSQISKHREQEASRDQWRADAQGMQGILSKLGTNLID